MKKITILFLVLSFSINGQSEYKPCFITIKGRLFDFENNKPIKRKVVLLSPDNRLHPEDNGKGSDFIYNDRTNLKGQFEIHTAIIDRNKPEFWLSVRNYSQINFINVQLEDSDFDQVLDLGDIYFVPFSSKIDRSNRKRQKNIELVISEIDTKLANNEMYKMIRNELEEYSSIMTYCNLSRKRSCNTIFSEYRILSFTRDLKERKRLENKIITNTISITGTVMSDSIPLESASVIIKNTKKGVATNEKGQFKIEAKKGDTLSISYIGYKTKDIVVNKKEELDINLEIGNNLEEIVIETYLSNRKICCGFSYCVTHVIESYADKSQLLFPNPSSSGIFQLKLNEDYEEVKISIANLSGQIIQNKSYPKIAGRLQIDLSQYTDGLYIISITADGRLLETIKAIKA